MPDWILNSKILTIVAAVVCVAVIVANVLGYIEQSLMLTVLGFVGFGGVAAFRDWINSQGWRTYLLAGLGLAGTIAMTLGWITPEAFIGVLSLLGVGSAGALVAAGKKAPVGSKLKTITMKKAA